MKKISNFIPNKILKKKEIIDEIPVSIELPPEGLTVVKIDKESGKLASKETTRPAFEYFLEENIPN